MNNDTTTKIHEIIKTTNDKAFELVKVGSGNTKELVHVPIFFNLEGIWMNKENLFDKQYEITKEIVNKQLKVTSKLVSDVGEHMNHVVIVGHEELYICLCIIFFVSTWNMSFVNYNV